MSYSEFKEKYDELKEKIMHMTPSRIIIFSFIVVIILGTIILTMPFASKGARISVLDALFTATSATCVTGLSLFDTFGTFTYIGQATILVLIQVGGLGLATFATAVTLFLRKKLGYKNLLLFSEISGSSSFDLINLLKSIMIITFSCEIIGALLLMIRFVPEYGTLGVWAAVFVSVSAFCNAGFDVLGFIPENSSISSFVDDPLVCLTIAALIFMGALGFLVIQDIYMSKIYNTFKKKPRTRLTFHSQVCIRMSLVLLAIGTLGFLMFEYSNTISNLSFFEKILASLFQSVNTRTAGFASIDIGAESEITKIMTICLMFIGGSPGSTAGGIKVTTFIVIFSTISSTIRGMDDATYLGHRFDKKIVFKALTIAFLGVVLVVVDAIILVFFSGSEDTLNILFECVSAFATVGLSAGLTSDLSVIGKIVITITMFIGRVGPASLGLAIMMRPRKTGGTILPEGRMLIG